MPKLPQSKPRPWIKQAETTFSRQDHKKFYDSDTWKRARVMQLNKEPVCRRCKKAFAVTVDHIIPIAAGGALLDGDNLQSLCKKCNDKKTSEDGNKAKRRMSARSRS